jgi:hypothetical protein
MFKTNILVGERVLVSGTDVTGESGKTIVDATQWNELALRKDVSKATADFDAAVEAFYAPLTDAADAAEQAFKGNKPDDASAYVVIQEEVPATPGQVGHTVRLTRDSVILRLIEEGNTDRLVWVDDQLEVLEVLPNTSTSAAVVTSGDPHADELVES